MSRCEYGCCPVNDVNHLSITKAICHALQAALSRPRRLGLSRPGPKILGGRSLSGTP